MEILIGAVLALIVITATVRYARSVGEWAVDKARLARGLKRRPNESSETAQHSHAVVTLPEPVLLIAAAKREHCASCFLIQIVNAGSSGARDLKLSAQLQLVEAGGDVIVVQPSHYRIEYLGPSDTQVNTHPLRLSVVEQNGSGSVGRRLLIEPYDFDADQRPDFEQGPDEFQSRSPRFGAFQTGISTPIGVGGGPGLVSRVEVRIEGVSTASGLPTVPVSMQLQLDNRVDT